MLDVFYFILFGLAAFLYTSVGHAGASAYIAIMTLAHFAPETIRPIALILNMLVAGMGSYRFYRAGFTDAKIILPLIVGSIPLAFLGGMVKINDTHFKIMLGIILIITAIRLLFPKGIPTVTTINRPYFIFPLILGAIIGFISGITGTGGGIFLSPIILLLGWVSVHTISGIAIVFIFFTSTSALFGLLTSVKSIPLSSFIYVIPVFIGAYLGQSYGIKADRTILMRFLAAVLLIAGAKLVLTG